MKIILCNKYFFLNGGTEKYLYTIMRQLSFAGHLPIPFSVQYKGSWESPYSNWFLPPPGDPDHTRHENIRVTPGNILRFLGRSIYSFEARRYLDRLIAAADGADIGYILNIYNYMSPSIIHAFKKRGIPVVMRLGDYNLLCPNYLLLRGGKPCTLCIRGAYLHGVTHCCVKNSYLVSAVRVTGMMIQKWLGLYKLVDAFIVPCEFMKSLLAEGGFPEKRIHVIRSPVCSDMIPRQPGKRDYIIYFGRISYEKGLDTLIRAYQQLSPPVDLILVGKSYDGEIDRLEQLIDKKHTNRIVFAGFKAAEDLTRLVSQALLSVVPSRWYDNAPLSVYESFSCGTPVLASRIGGIPEQIQDGINGRLCDPDSEQDMRNVLEWMLCDRERLGKMGAAAREYADRTLSMNRHVEKVLELFYEIKSARGV